jgi:hypothetical protein
MTGSATIEGNTAFERGGGVHLAGNYLPATTSLNPEAPRFNINFGATGGIADNTARRGGGVYVGTNGSFIMNNGTISENNVIGINGAEGGGVCGNFTMHNGLISKNNVNANNTGSSYGASAAGGGVSGYLIMYDGIISGNNVSAIRTHSNGYAGAYGGGVYGRLTMSNGTISGNTVRASNDINTEMISTCGGGVYTGLYSTHFNKTGGIIYGNNSTVELRNIAIGGKGHVVYSEMDSGNWRNATTEPSDISERLDYWLNEIDITYNVVPDASLTSLIFTFSEDPGNLLASHITLCENVSRGNASLSGIGTERILSPITLNGNDTITVSIFSVYKIETGYKYIYIKPNTPTTR